MTRIESTHASGDRARPYGRVARPDPSPTIDLREEPQKLETSLTLAHVAGVVMLLRSVAFDRWISVLAAAALLTGVAAARRNKTWGVALAFASAAAFPSFVLLGLAPPWFVLVGALGMLPFAVASRAFARFDRSATMLLGTIGASLGALLAFGWRSAAPFLFENIPLLRPSYEAQHGLPLVALTGALVFAALARARREGKAKATTMATTRVRIGERVRIASANDAELSYAEALEELDEADPTDAEVARFARPRSQPSTNASATSREAKNQPPKRDHASGS